MPPRKESVILVHDETESVLDTLFPVTDYIQPSTRVSFSYIIQDSRRLASPMGPRLQHLLSSNHPAQSPVQRDEDFPRAGTALTE